MLIDSDRQVCLCNFGLSSIVQELQGSQSYFTSNLGGSVRWADAHFFLSGVYEDDQLPQVTSK